MGVAVQTPGAVSDLVGSLADLLAAMGNDLASLVDTLIKFLTSERFLEFAVAAGSGLLAIAAAGYFEYGMQLVLLGMFPIGLGFLAFALKLEQAGKRLATPA